MIKIIKKFIIILLLIITKSIGYIGKSIYNFLDENRNNITRYYRSFRCVLKEELEK